MISLAFAVVTEDMSFDERREWVANLDDNAAATDRRIFAGTFGG